MDTLGESPDDPSSPHWDPNWHEPEIAVPGLGQWPDDYVVDHGGDPNYVSPDHVDVEAPNDPRQQRKNAEAWQVFRASIIIDGKPSFDVGGSDLDSFRFALRAALINLLAVRGRGGFVQVQCLDAIRQQWIDPSGGNPPPNWDGLLNVELKINCGWGILL